MRNRIRQLMEYEGMNAAQFSKKVNINTSVLSHLLGGRNNPSYDIVVKILDNCPEVNVEWFMRGVGPMLKDSTSVESPVEAPDYPDLFSNSQPKEPVPVRQAPDQPRQVHVSAPKTPEISKSRIDAKPTAEYRSENMVAQPGNQAKQPETQQNNVQKSCTRQISRILVFYTDNTYEEFSSQRS